VTSATLISEEIETNCIGSDELPCTKRCKIRGHRDRLHRLQARRDDQARCVVLASSRESAWCAGNAGGQFLCPAEDITPQRFRTVIRLNLGGRGG
jgi:hypothetical protein